MSADDDLSFVDVVQTKIRQLRGLGTTRRSKKSLKNSKKMYPKKKYVPESVKPGDLKYGDYKVDDGLTKKYFRSDTEDAKVMTNKEFFLAGACLNDLYITKIVDQRIKANLNTHVEKETLVCGGKQWIQYIRKNFTDGWHVVEFGETAGMIIDWEDLFFIDYTTNSNSVEIKIYGSKEDVEHHLNTLTTDFTVATCHIEWVYSSDGSSVDIPLLGEKLPVKEMYPFLKDESIEDYYDRFLNSSASILLLIGPPGTGKTTFIRGLLHYASKNAIVTYDEKLLEKDYVFARFIEDDVSVMVIEDADNFLRSRSDGNSMMHRFLNVGDGLITVKGKKLVFSTNLPSIKDVDPALVRPGRCFDIVNFEHYTEDQAKKLADKLGVTFTAGKESYSLAEIFHQQTYVKPPKKVGFV